MGKSLKLAIVGGDERQAYLARLAQADGHSIRTFALERAENVPRSPDLASCLTGADAVLLPVPVTQGEICCVRRQASASRTVSRQAPA